jgi:hypothetical protein
VTSAFLLYRKSDYHNNNICTSYCPGCNDLLCTKCVTENHSGHPLQEIEIVHQKRHNVISDTVKEIHNLQRSDLSDKQHATWAVKRAYVIIMICTLTFQSFCSM